MKRTELALTICEMFQKDYLNRPIWQTMIDIENLIDKHRPQQLIITDVVVSLFCKCTIPNLNYGKGENKKCNKCGKLPK